MRDQKRCVIVITLILAATGLFVWWRQANQTVLRVRDFKTQQIYNEVPVSPGDHLFFGWMHSLEHIPWNEEFHITKAHTLMLDEISFPAFGAGIPENKGKRTWVDKTGMIHMAEIGQDFPYLDWINSHYATREIKVNETVVTTGKQLPEHRRLLLRIEKKGFLNGYGKE